MENIMLINGRIMNLDENTIKYLSKDINKYLTWEVNEKKVLKYAGIS